MVLTVLYPLDVVIYRILLELYVHVGNSVISTFICSVSIKVIRMLRFHVETTYGGYGNLSGQL